MIDYEARILEAQERETHPELGTPEWGNVAADAEWEAEANAAEAEMLALGYE